MNQTHTFRRPAACLLAAGLCLAVVAARGDEQSLSRHVPADIGLFAEARAAGDLLLPLIEPELWTALAEAIGQPSRPEDVRAWREQIAKTIKFDPDIAIRVLFSRRVAFIGEGLGRTQDAVVLCQPIEGARVEDLLRIWQAQPVAGPGAAGDGRESQLYQLALNIGLVTKDGLLLFGDMRLPQGVFQKVAGFLREPKGRSLADDPTYRELLRRVPPEPDGVLFARLGPPATTQAAPVPEGLGIPELPGPLRGASAVLFALHRSGALLHFTAVGEVPRTARGERSAAPPLLPGLPRRTLLAWDGRVDYADLLARVQELPPQNLLRLGLELQQGSSDPRRLVEALRPRACIALGVAGSRPGAPPLPALAVLIPASDAALAEREFTALVGSAAAQYSFVALARGLPGLEPLREEGATDGPRVRRLDLAPVLPPRVVQTLGHVGVWWTVEEDVLIVATHRSWLDEIVGARRGSGARLDALLDLPAARPSRETETLIVAHSGALAQLGQQWLDHLSRTTPQILEEHWWRRNQPRGGRVRLGVRGDVDGPGRRLIVRDVEAASPSDGVLRAGDHIVGCSGTRFATTQPVQEIQERIETRPHARFVELLVERDGVLIAPRVAVPFFDPIQALRRVIAIGGVVRRMVYFDDAGDGSQRGFLTLELRGAGEGEAFDFGPPASQPASERARVEGAAAAPASQPGGGQ
ncbi:MAG: hypothetical protein LC135_05960 [Phycisphaerae bacterium]|nr:hypothetical protein [Phycisphaerae bacterium]MCZ2399401.1 hypothetical protein [Phycisphaerae bacterium]